MGEAPADPPPPPLLSCFLHRSATSRARRPALQQSYFSPDDPRACRPARHRCGYLRRFISPESQARNQAQNQTLTQQPPLRQTTTQHQQSLREIQVISGGFAGCGESSSARKAHLCSIRSAGIGEIQTVSKLPRLDTSITFSDSNLEGCQHPP